VTRKLTQEDFIWEKRPWECPICKKRNEVAVGTPAFWGDDQEAVEAEVMNVMVACVTCDGCEAVLSSPMVLNGLAAEVTSIVRATISFEESPPWWFVAYTWFVLIGAVAGFAALGLAFR